MTKEAESIEMSSLTEDNDNTSSSIEQRGPPHLPRPKKSAESGSGGSSSDTTAFMTPILTEKVLRKRYELRSTRGVSYMWVILPVICYFAVIVGGIMTSIGVGNASAAFDSYCIFNANFTLVMRTNGTRLKLEDFRPVFGNRNDCLFCEYGSVGLALFSGVWIVMVLQCGRGGQSKRGFRLPDAWRIVPPTCIGSTIIFFVSCFILSNVSTGFVEFCENSVVILDGEAIGGIANANLTCSQVLSFNYFRMDKYHTVLLREWTTAQIGATVQFIGCFLSFLIVLVRCCTGPDFDLYVKRDVAYVPAHTDEEADDEEQRKLIENEPKPGCSKDVLTTDTEAVVQVHQQDDQDDQDPFGSIKSTTGLIVN